MKKFLSLLWLAFVLYLMCLASSVALWGAASGLGVGVEMTRDLVGQMSPVLVVWFAVVGWIMGFTDRE